MFGGAAMGNDVRMITITARISRRRWFLFTTLCRAHGVPVYAALDQVIQDALERLGVTPQTSGGDETRNLRSEAEEATSRENVAPHDRRVG